MKNFFFTCFIALAIIPSVFAQKNNTNQLLWKIYKKGSPKVSYIYGTIHIRDKRVFNFSDSVLIGLNSCEVMANEFNVEQGFSELFKLLRSSDTTGLLSQEMGKKEYADLNDKMVSQTGISIDKLKSKNSWVLKFFNERSQWKEDENNSKQTFLDAYLAGIAKKSGKKITGLETVDDYASVYAGYIEKQNNPNPTDSIDAVSIPNYDVNIDYQELLLKLYESGDIEKIYNYYSTYSDKKDLRALQIRNDNMVNRMDSIMNKSSLFTAVGSAHLAGDSGMIALLRKKGYTVEAVTPLYTGLAAKYNYEELDYKWSQFTNEDSTFSLKTPMELIPYPLKEREFEYNLYTTFDLYTYSYFMAMNIKLGTIISKDKEEAVFKNMSSKTLAKQKMILLSEKYYPNATPSRYELFTKKGSSYIRINYTSNNGEVIVTMVGGTKKIVYGTNAEKFVTSLKLLQKTKPIEGFVKMTETAGAYEVIMPLSAKNFEENVTDIDGGTNVVKMKYNNAPVRGNLYMSVYYLFKGENIVITDDSLYFDNLFSSFANSENVIVVNKKYSLFDDKYNALDITLKNALTNNIQLIKYIVRDNRPYLFLVEGTETSLKDESVTTFF